MTRGLALLLSVVVLPIAVAPPARADLITIPVNGVLLKDDAVPPIDPKKRYFKMRSTTNQVTVDHQITMPPSGSAGDPTVNGASGGGATLTVYNAAGTGEVFTIALPAANWIQIGANPPKRYRYAAATGPVRRIFLRPGILYVRADGPTWGYTLDEPSQGRIAMRFTAGTGDTWCFDVPPWPPQSRYDYPGKFQTYKNAPAATCPPLPGE
jgi:hypothetical protein